MALQWDWKDKVGEAVVEQNGSEYTVDLYQGNAYLIFINEYTEDGVDKYTLWSFWADKEHAKVCLGLKKGVDQSNIYTAYESQIKTFRLSKKTRHLSEIVGLLVKAFDNINIEIYKEDEDE